MIELRTKTQQEPKVVEFWHDEKQSWESALMISAGTSYSHSIYNTICWTESTLKLDDGTLYKTSFTRRLTGVTS